VPQKEGAVLGIFRHLRPIGLNGQNDVFVVQKYIRLVREKLIFLYGQYVNISLESTFQWLSEDVLKIEVDAGVFENNIGKNVALDTRKMDAAATCKMQTCGPSTGKTRTKICGL